MAAMCLWRSLRETRRHGRALIKHLEYRRNLLTEAYECRGAWKDHQISPTLGRANAGLLALKIHKKFTEEGYAHPVDLDLLANKLDGMHPEDNEYIKSLLRRFRESKGAFPIQDSVVHGIVRNYIHLGMESELLMMMKDKPQYGFIPNGYTASLLMNHFIKAEKYAEAAQVAYEVMLQEDFSPQTTVTLVAMYACIKHLKHTAVMDAHQNSEDIDDDEDDDDDDENVKWVAKGMIHDPSYDDHFDIQSDQFILGKTLTMLGKTEGHTMLGRTLQITGMALHNKFFKAIDLLKQWEESTIKGVIMTEALTRLTELLDAAPTRNPNKPEKDIGLRTLEDAIRKLNLTPEEKEQCTADLKLLTEKLRQNQQLMSHNLEERVETYVKSNVKRAENVDIENQLKAFKQWEMDRKDTVHQQAMEYKRSQKIEDIANKLLDLQEKEETIRFFENTNVIHKAKMRAPWENKKSKDELTTDELEGGRGQKRAKMSAIRRRKK